MHGRRHGVTVTQGHASTGPLQRALIHGPGGQGARIRPAAE